MRRRPMSSHAQGFTDGESEDSCAHNEEDGEDNDARDGGNEGGTTGQPCSEAPGAFATVKVARCAICKESSKDRASQNIGRQRSLSLYVAHLESSDVVGCRTGGATTSRKSVLVALFERRSFSGYGVVFIAVQTFQRDWSIWIVGNVAAHELNCALSAMSHAMRVSTCVLSGEHW